MSNKTRARRSVYVQLRPRERFVDLRTEEIDEGVSIDYDTVTGAAVGVEIRDALAVEIDGEPLAELIHDAEVRGWLSTATPNRGGQVDTPELIEARLEAARRETQR